MDAGTKCRQVEGKDQSSTWTRYNKLTCCALGVQDVLWDVHWAKCTSSLSAEWSISSPQRKERRKAVRRLFCVCCQLCEWCRWKVKSKRLERDAEKQRKIGELAELRCAELEQELDGLKAQRNSNIQQFEQLKKQFTDILVCLIACLSVGP